MFEVLGRRRRDLLAPARRFRYRCGIRLAHVKRAWGYVAGKLSTDDARRMILDCRGRAGWHPLLVLKVEDTLQQARDEFADHPELRRLIADACFHVGDRWEPAGDELWQVRRWAINVALRYAAAEGIPLVGLAAASPTIWRAPADAGPATGSTQ